jgi:hypothetical protein
MARLGHIIAEDCAKRLTVLLFREWWKSVMIRHDWLLGLCVQSSMPEKKVDNEEQVGHEWIASANG